nr:ankyrin repeat domain-containing protein 63 [Anolis sagrei ordinatus]
MATLRPRDLGPGASTRTFLSAMASGRLRLARFVLDALEGAFVDCRAERGRTPLMLAVLLPEPGARLAFARLLLERGAAADLRDDTGRSALSLACERGDLEAAQLLVRHGADPDAPDAEGRSPLMYAAGRGHSALLEWLLRAFRRLGQLGLDRADRRGRTALQWAREAGHARCVRALRQAGASPAAQEDQEEEEEKAPATREGRPLEAEDVAAPRARPLRRRATAPDGLGLAGP